MKERKEGREGERQRETLCVREYEERCCILSVCETAYEGDLNSLVRCPISQEPNVPAC